MILSRVNGSWTPTRGLLTRQKLLTNLTHDNNLDPSSVLSLTTMITMMTDD